MPNQTMACAARLAAPTWREPNGVPLRRKKCSLNRGNSCVDYPGCPIIMNNDGFVLTQHDITRGQGWPVNFGLLGLAEP